MAHEETALRTAIEIGCWSVALAGAAVLLLALIAELVRPRRASAPLITFADRLLPSTSRRIAVALLTVCSTITALAVPSAVRADDHTRTWLEDGAREPTTRSAGPRTTSTTASSTTSTTSTTTTTISPGAPSTGAVEPTTSPPLDHGVEPTKPAIAAPRASAVLRDTPAPVTAVAPSPGGPGGPTYTVAPGDCLWSIAARQLGVDASAPSIDHSWRAIYASNRDAVGPDPDLIHPGLVLTLPPLDPTP